MHRPQRLARLAQLPRQHLGARLCIQTALQLHLHLAAPRLEVGDATTKHEHHLRTTLRLRVQLRQRWAKVGRRERGTLPKHVAKVWVAHTGHL
jgi:hypothetical protein